MGEKDEGDARDAGRGKPLADSSDPDKLRSEML